MSYQNAKEILPEKLMKEIQQYVQGQTLYIPRKDEPKRWGEKSGSRKALYERNEAICKAYAQGATKEQLAQKYYLSVETIRKIIYQKGKKSFK
ncbi:CD3324 family protein [Kurthia gibsonii]|uniref:CD3324 family protein n=1 Tax=Kurthia gibsonii TaxID=33946 RepID=UPI002DB6EB25|nr:CD3324 family protein [Kurthia gibsonii]MEB7771011.1 CD3324 family protein [Kurthia gibsonii]